MDLVKPLITLLAIVNPLAIVPFFIHDTQGYAEAQRKRTAWVSAFSAFVVSALLGLQLLAFCPSPTRSRACSARPAST
jgi:multiple antibiotic resistance protein